MKYKYTGKEAHLFDFQPKFQIGDKVKIKDGAYDIIKSQGKWMLIDKKIYNGKIFRLEAEWDDIYNKNKKELYYYVLEGDSSTDGNFLRWSNENHSQRKDSTESINRDVLFSEDSIEKA